jgi:hypothetical protein
LPGANASDAQITEFYKSDQRWRIVLAGLYVGPFAGLAFVWFLVALRMWVDTSARRVNLLRRLSDHHAEVRMRVRGCLRDLQLVAVPRDVSSQSLQLVSLPRYVPHGEQE